MEFVKLSIKGANIIKILDLIKQDLKRYYSRPTEDVYIFFSEEYFLRTSSSLMVTLVINFMEEDVCQIEIYSGGGGQGPFNADLGSELDNVNYIRKNIEKVCKEREWEIFKNSKKG